MTDPFGDISSERLTAFIAGQLDPQEEQRIAAWVAADGERQAYVRELRELWELAGKARPEWDAEAVLRTIKARAAAPSVTPLPQSLAGRTVHAARWSRRALLAAA